MAQEVALAAYSMDRRLRVLRDADAGLPSDELAEKYSVSRAWVDRLKQRRRETGEVAPRKQTRWRTPILHAQRAELAARIREQPDRTLAGTAPGRDPAPDVPRSRPGQFEGRMSGPLMVLKIARWVSGASWDVPGDRP